MYLISDTDYRMLLRISEALVNCRGSTIKEQNALRNLKRLSGKFNRKRKCNDTIRADTTRGPADTGVS